MPGKWREMRVIATPSSFNSFAAVDGKVVGSIGWRQLATISVDATGIRLGTPLEGTFDRLKAAPDSQALLAIGETQLHLFSLAGGRLKPVRSLEAKLGHRRAAAFIGEDLYVTHANGVALVERTSRGPIRHLFDVPDDDFFSRYPTDLLSFGPYLFVAGRHAGLHVYRRDAVDRFTLVRSVRRGYTPTELQWWEPGRTLLLVGNDSIVPVDTTNPETFQVLKSLKFGGFEVCAPLLRVGKRRAFALAVGSNGSRLGFFDLDFTNALTPRITASQKLTPGLRIREAFFGDHERLWVSGYDSGLLEFARSR